VKVPLENCFPDPTLTPSSQYIPARSAWGNTPRHGTPPVNTNIPQAPIAGRNRSPIELATTGHSPVRSQQGPPHSPSHRRASSDNYYEDVDPRFSDPAPPESNNPAAIAAGRVTNPPDPYAQPGAQQNINQTNNTNFSRTMSPPRQNTGNSSLAPQRQPLEQSNSYDSEGSNLASVSQRGVNPQWRPGMGNERPPERYADRGAYGPGGVPIRGPGGNGNGGRIPGTF
jgi:hypothetical protein